MVRRCHFTQQSPSIYIHYSSKCYHVHCTYIGASKAAISTEVLNSNQNVEPSRIICMTKQRPEPAVEGIISIEAEMGNDAANEL